MSKTFKAKNEPNCLYECLVSLAQNQCKCLPWDFVSKSDGNKEECDIFGRECFLNTLEYFGLHGSQKCGRCKKDCDYMNYFKSLK